VVTERKAWELLFMVDQIHIWGVTDFRDFVIHHLKPWHEFCKICHVLDTDSLPLCDGFDFNALEAQGMMWVLPLPEWTRHLSDSERRRLLQVSAKIQREAVLKYRSGNVEGCHGMGAILSCLDDGCGPFPGYPLTSAEEAFNHFRDFHGDADDVEILDWLRRCFNGMVQKGSSKAAENERGLVSNPKKRQPSPTDGAREEHRKECIKRTKR